MPEEINRIVTDSLADLLLTPSQDANENLKREGVADSKIKLVGNIMIDALIANLQKSRASNLPKQLGLLPNQFVYVTLHRPSNVDDKHSLTTIMAELKRLTRELPVVFPVHPRTRDAACKASAPVLTAVTMTSLMVTMRYSRGVVPALRTTRVASV